MWGVVIGDVVGSVYEMTPIKTKAFDPFFHPQGHFTDDTVSTIALAECLLDSGDPATYLRRWCQKHPSLRYGAKFYRWMRSNNAGPYQSFGNGAAMRVSAAAMRGSSLERALLLSDQLTAITHDHPEGIKGARATTEAIWLCFEGVAPEVIRTRIQETYGYDLGRTVDQIRPGYTVDASCQRTVPEAIICALEAADFEDAVRNAISLGGDADTLAAIAGSIAEARFGCPPALVDHVKQLLPVEMIEVLERLYRTGR